MIDDELMSALMQLGFTQYEAKAWIALLGQAPMNGHEAAKLSQIPTSKIYDTLNRLVDKGAAQVHQSEPITYFAIPWNIVKSAAKAKFERSLAAAEAGLTSHPKPAADGKIWTLRDTDTVIDIARSLIDAAQQSIFASIWDQEIGALKESLEAASARGVVCHVAMYGTSKLSGPHAYDLTLCGNSVLERLNGRRLTAVVADQVDCVLAEFHQGDRVEGVRTRNSVVGLLAAEYVKSDVLGRFLIDDIGNERFSELRSSPTNRIDILLRS